MSLQAKQGYVVPDSTAQVARAILPEGSPVMRMFDELHMIVTDHDFADLFPARGQPAEAPVRLALATLGQFMEGLTDRQAAHAVRTRIDWKSLLCLELSDTGLDPTVLSEFRSRLLEHGAEQRRFDAVLTRAKTRGVLKAGARPRSDSTPVLGAMRAIDQARQAWPRRCVMRSTSWPLAGEWLLAHTTPEWVDRYALRSSEFHLPRSAADRQAWAARTGTDAMGLLEALVAQDKTKVARRLPAVQTPRQVWVQNFLVDNPTDGPPCVLWRTNDNAPPAKRYIGSPCDTDARYAKKGSAVWHDCNLHLTQTCDEATPNLITPVQTTPAAVTDDCGDRHCPCGAGRARAAAIDPHRPHRPQRLCQCQAAGRCPSALRRGSRWPDAGRPPLAGQEWAGLCGT